MAFADLSDEQLVHKMMSTERELIAARFAHAANQLENTASLRVLRKDIARLQTEARTRETAGGLNKDALIAKYRGSFSSDGAPAAAGEQGGFLQGIVDKLASAE
jgi:large subunit ribosomal protein L29